MMTKKITRKQLKEKIQKKNHQKNNISSSLTFSNATICFGKEGFSRKRIYFKIKGIEYEARSECDIQIKRSAIKRNITLKSSAHIYYGPIGDNGDYDG
ncbi:hypothetical protein [Fibrobacter sp. UBA4297]|uniref:hypothetical protein n=1 Tax=Fibrobacter sp. UBA4297 TaxID=1946536 RepID=UPI0025B7C769|nr:hypothetical protein [Fibrobacter sp. UBA4297]